MASHRILYVGSDITLLLFLRDVLKKIDSEIVRCPGGSNARLLIESNITYSLLLFDEELLDTTGAKLKRFARKLPHRKETPILILERSDDRQRVANGIVRLLG
jgi:DNA-binding response OmpR family regulator